MSPGYEFEPPDIGALHVETGGAPAASGESDGAVSALLQRETDRLMQIDGVVMVGEGLDGAGRPAVVIGVKLRHNLANLPASLEGVPVVGWVIGEVDALNR